VSRTVPTLLAALAVCVAAAGCEKSAHGTAGSSGEPSIKVVSTDRPAGLDPATATDAGARALLPNVYQTLLTIPPGETTPVPDAADCQFDTPTTYTCTMRSGLTFHNGHKLDAADVKYSIDRLRTVPGAGRGAALFASVASVEADEDTVTFNLRRPDATLPYALTTPAASIVDQEVYAADRPVEPAEAAGSGPYRVVRYAAKGALVLERFTGYKGVRPARNGTVEIGFPSAGATAGTTAGAAVVAAVEAGRADLGIGAILPRAQAPATTSTPAGTAPRLSTLDGTLTGWWTFHLNAPAARYQVVRRAVAQLVDREALVRRVYGETATASYSLLPAGFEGHVDAFRDSYGVPDRAKAAALLRAAKLHVPVPVTIGWTARPGGTVAREVDEVRRQLQASGLFRVTVRQAPGPQFAQRAASGAYDLFPVERDAELPDGDGFVSPVLRPGGRPAYGYASVAAARLVEAERTGQSLADRERAFGDLQRLLATDVPVLPVWQGRTALLAASRLTGADSALDRTSAVRFAYLGREGK